MMQSSSILGRFFPLQINAFLTLCTSVINRNLAGNLVNLNEHLNKREFLFSVMQLVAGMEYLFN